jgi:carboxylate-amine ligase
MTQSAPVIEHAYGSSTPYSLGVEEEFQLVHRETFELASRIDVVLGNATEVDKQCIKPELLQSVIESATKVCTTVQDARTNVTELRTRLAELADASDCFIASAGTHPYSRYEFQKVTDNERYLDIISRLKWIAQRELIFGLHVHVGIDTPEKAIAVFNGVRQYLPQLLALSANSPLWQGRHTGLQSSRSKVFDSFPRSGLPQSFESWDAWCDLMRRAMDTGAIQDYTYIWWDVRLHPKYGTVEVRVCDAQTDVDYTIALTALIQAMCAWIGARFEAGEPDDLPPLMLIAENKWSAARYGLDGTFIDFDTDKVVPTREAIGTLVENVRPFAKILGSESELDLVDKILVCGNGAHKQLAVYAQSESPVSVAEMLVKETSVA